MATFYVDCTTSGGKGTNTGAGSELSPWTSVYAAYTSAAAGDTILIKAAKETPFLPDANIQDTKGIKFDAWGSSKFFVNASGMTGNFIFRLEHVNSGLKNADIRGVTDGGRYAVRINANIADGAFSDCFLHDSVGASAHGVITAAGITGTVKIYRVHCARVQRAWSIDALGVGGIVELYDCRDEDLRSWSQVTGANSVVKTYRHLSGGHLVHAWIAQTGGRFEHYDTITIGGGRDAAYDTMRNEGVGACSINRGVVTYPVLDAAPFNVGFRNTSTGSLTISPETKGPNGGAGKLFAKMRRPTMLCFIRDDVEDYVQGGMYSGELATWLDILESHGIRGTYPCTTQQGDNPTAITPAQWAEIKTVADRGHEIAGHGRTGCHLRFAGAVGMTMQYTGADATVRFVIANNRLRTYHNGSTTPTRDIDLMEPQRTISNIVATLNANGYAAGIVTTGTSLSDAIPARCLADVDVSNAKTAVNNLIVDAEKLYQWEIVGAAADILTNTGYQMKTHIYSAGSVNRTIADKIIQGGFLGARQAHISVPNYADSPSKFVYTDTNYHRGEMFGMLLEDRVDRSSTQKLRQSIEAICHWAMWHGVPVALYAHQFAVFSQNEWDVVISAAKATGIPIGTYSEVCKFAKNIEQSRLPLAEQQALDDAWVPTLAADSVMIPWYYGAQGGSVSGLQYRVSESVYLPI